MGCTLHQHAHSHGGGGHGHGHAHGAGGNQPACDVKTDGSQGDIEEGGEGEQLGDDQSDASSTSPTPGGSVHKPNINVRAAFIHVIGDFLQSVGVFIAALVIFFKVC